MIVNYLMFENFYLNLRIGRGGRFGRKGVAINFVTPEDFANLQDIQNFYQTKISELPVNINSLMKQ